MSRSSVLIRLVAAVVLLNLGTVAIAKNSLQFRFDNYSQEQGLTNNQVQSIFQDRDGWMWFGTSHGLNRFDGQHFKRYKMRLKGDANPTGGLIRDIFQDRSGAIWVGVEKEGLFRLRKGLEEFEPFPIKGLEGVSVNAIKSDGAGNIWLGSDSGLYRLTESKTGFTASCIRCNDRSLSVGMVKEIVVDHRGVVWAGTDKGLFSYNPRNHHLRRVKVGAAGYLADEVWSLYIDACRKIWVGTYNSGIYLVSADGRSAQKLLPYPAQDRSQTVKAIIQDKNGDYWFGTRAGLYSYSAGSRQFTFYGHDDEEQTSLGQSSILSLFVDAKGDLWVGTRGGVSYLIDEKKYFKHYSMAKSRQDGLNDSEIYAIWPASNEEVWLGTESGGINILNRKTDKFSVVNRTNSALKSDCVKGFMPDGRGNVWVSTYMGGISVVNIATRRVVKSYTSAPVRVGGLSDNRIWTTFMDSKKRIWVGSYKGVDLYDPMSDRFIPRKDIVGFKQINWIDEDASGDLWFGANDYLVIYNPSTGGKRIVNEVVRSFYHLPNGEYMLATQGHGLALYDKKRGIRKFLTEADGLANDFTYSIVDDGLGGLWISTSNGLSRFDKASQTFMNYYRVDGLQNNQFNYGAYAKTSSGELLFGGINGFNLFNPKSVKPNGYKPPVVITSISIFNEPLQIGDDEGNYRSICTTKEVTLRYNQNMITFDYAALNYAKSNKNRYSYKLEGLEDRWINAGNRTTVTYSNLAPGTYKFRVKGANSDGLWNEQGAAITIKIRPPFWGTIWFRGIMLLVLIGTIILVVQFLTNRANLRNKLVFEKTKAKKLNEIDSMKQQFFTNVSHEIRTPLTLIIGPVEKMIENPSLSKDDRVMLEMVRNNTQLLMKLVNQILDFKKLETGKLQADYDKGDLVRFLESAVKPFYFMSEEKGVKLVVDFPERELAVWMDTDKLAKIVNNLLSNAFKFTGQGGEVKVRLQVTDSYSFEDIGQRACYEISVSDTGTGMPASSVDKVFNRFFQSSNSKGVTGTGIGLSIVKEFVKLLHGDVDVQSEMGEGTTFVVRLPILEDYEVENSDTDGGDLSMAKSEDQEKVAASAKYLLVVDDNADMRTFIREHFKYEFTILEAENGKVGFDLAVKYIPEVVISDVIMPVMDGRELCRKLKKDERTSHIPIVLLTAADSKESEMSGLIAGADDYITKPFDLSILNVKIDNLLLLRNKLREKLKTDILLQPTNISIASPDERFLRKAVEVVEKYMSEPDLDIELFSSEVGVSRMQLYRKLEALTSMTVKEFIRDIRLRRAAQLLEQDKITISEVVYAVGFRDLAHFRKCFKDVYGMSPSSYLEKVRNEKQE
jgi:signal transduction histidine kinase/ligand-binding sensor domain-containing protein/DNA-binding response OmpR family regulator